MDEVDEVMAAWHRERPDLATSPMAVWSRIHRLAALLDAARKRCFAEHGLDNWEFDVLAALRRVDRLCDRGLVTRHAAPSDGRSVVVGLTGAGRRAVDNALEALVELEESLLAGWSAGERESLAAMLRRLLA